MIKSLKKLAFQKVLWINKLNEIKKGPSIFLANEFFDALPIKQFIKKKNKWFEKKVKIAGKDNFLLIDKPNQISKLEKKATKEIIFNKLVLFKPLFLKTLISP